MSTTSEIPVGDLALTGVALTAAVRVGSTTKTWKFLSSNYRTQNLAALSFSDITTAVDAMAAADQALLIAAIKGGDTAAAGRIVHDAVTTSLKATAETQTAAVVGADAFTLNDLELLF